jgi:tRNA dimethylallyltransferase
LKTLGKTLIVIAGPTAVGKTALAIRLAHQFKTEILSADSRQFFKELVIGTAKPTEEELASVTHHFINNLTIQQEYDAAQFGEDALNTINRLFESHNTVILCGGSGLYIKAVCEGFDDIPEVPEGIRMQLMEQYDLHGISWLQEQMKNVDPDHFEALDIQNPHRLIRALEVQIGTGKSIATFRRNKKREHDFTIIKIGLELPREELYNRINSRMDNMIGEGLFEEARQLFPYRSHRALQTVGYQEIFGYIEGQYNQEEAIRLLKRNSRRYAKRQMTWFKKDPEMVWFTPDQADEIFRYITTDAQANANKSHLNS